MSSSYETENVKQIKIARKSINGVRLPRTPNPEVKRETFGFLKRKSISK